MQAFAGWAEGGADQREAYPKGVASGECQVESGKWKECKEWRVDSGRGGGRAGVEWPAHRHKGKVAKSKTKVVRFYCHINA